MVADVFGNPIRFSHQSLDILLRSAGMGAAFQTFVLALLRSRFADLHAFPVTGRDGAIDGAALDQTESGLTGFAVFECKYTSENTLEAVRGAWKEVADALSRNLESSNGPKSGAAQYRPWYRTDRPVARYVFCTSVDLRTLNRHDALKDEIAAFFGALPTGRPHLAHLGGVTVELFDWSDLDRLLSDRPDLQWQYFPATRPNGLAPLTAGAPSKGFHAYLEAEKLPYYSFEMHLQSEPSRPGGQLRDERGWLDSLVGGAHSGLIITGSGGVGKTRLMLELGRMAAAGGTEWAVLRSRARQPLTVEAVDHAAQRAPPGKRVLLLLDYVETQSHFAAIVDRVSEINERAPGSLAFIANCRTSYYDAIADSGDHQRLDLSTDGRNKKWWESYRKATVRHVLVETGVGCASEHLRACRGSPVLAAFFAYAQERWGTLSGNEELQALRDDEDFGDWVLTRIRRSFGNPRAIEDDLAMVIATLPLPRSLPRSLTEGTLRDLFLVLHQDGWVEPEIDPQASDNWGWVVTHDVIADAILQWHLRNLGALAESFVERLLERARSWGVLSSAFIALQRLSDTAEIQSLPIGRLIAADIRKAPAEWRPWCGAAIRSPLLGVDGKLDLLDSGSELWSEPTGEWEVQSALGWSARHVARMDQGPNRDRLAGRLRPWLLRVADDPGLATEYPLSWGLKLDPKAFERRARAWIERRPDRVDTHYLMTKWLKARLSVADIAAEVGLWLTRFRVHPKLSFVARSWLEAGGERGVVAQPIRDWLARHAQAPDAQFIYKAWLDAGGEQGPVAQPIRDWLSHHAGALEARFVYQAWLDAGGECGLMEQPIRDWLAHHAEALEASHVYKAWLDTGGEPGVVERPIRDWLAHHAEALEARFVYRAWLDAGGECGLMEQPIRDWLAHHAEALEASYVYEAWLAAGGGCGLVAQPIRDWLAHHAEALEASHVYKAWLDVQGPFELVKSHAVRWLAVHRERRDAAYVTKRLAEQADLPPAAARDILVWCWTFPDDVDALWRLSYLGKHLLLSEIRRDVIRAWDTVLTCFIEAKQIPEAGAKEVFINLVNRIIWISWKQRKFFYLSGPGERAMAAALRRMDIFVPGGLAEITMRPELPSIVYLMLERGIMDGERDHAALLRFSEWLRSWPANLWREIEDSVLALRRRHPGEGLWLNPQ